MTRPGRCAVLVAVTIAGLLSPAVTAQNQNDADAIRAIRAASNAAIAARDLAALRDTWIDEVNVTGSSGTVFAGDEAMAAAFGTSFEDPEFVHYVRTPTTIQVSENVFFAAEEGTWVGTWERHDGTMRLRGTYLAQWQKRGGDWKLASEVFVALSCAGSAECEQVLPDHRNTTAPKMQQSHWSESAMLVGEVVEADLREAPFDEWFVTAYDSYEPDPEIVAELAEALGDDVELEVFFGTWCGDSKREVPRLLRTLDAMDFPRDRVRILALSDHPGEFKKSPGARERDYLIHRTPTIVVDRGDEEVGRIVERPAGRLEADLLAIARGSQPETPYGAEAELHARYHSGNTALVTAPTPEFLTELEELGNTDSLWHYAYYDLLVNGRAADAADVLRLFLTFHPDSARGYQLLGQAHFDLGETSAALYAVRRALALDPDHRAGRRLERRILESLN